MKFVAVALEVPVIWLYFSAVSGISKTAKNTKIIQP